MKTIPSLALSDAQAEEFARHWVERPSGCHVWTGRLDRDGYGRMSVAGVDRSAHRIAYEAARGPIPPGLVIDHLCRNKACVNQEHLEAVTNRENVHRGLLYALRTHCKNGHPLSGDNLHLMNGDPFRRVCKACRREFSRRWKQRNRTSAA